MQQFALRALAPAVPQAAPRVRARARPLPAASTQPAFRRSSRPAATRFRVSCAAAESSLPPPVSLRVVFSLRCSVEFGASVLLVGSHEALGNWDVAQALPLTWSAGDIWTCTAELPEHFVVRYKARVADGRKLRARARCGCARRTPRRSRPLRAQFIVIRADGTLQWQPGEDSTTIASRAAARLGADAAVPLDVFRLNAKARAAPHARRSACTLAQAARCGGAARRRRAACAQQLRPSAWRCPG